jgi:hypothetical protein
VQLVVHGRQLPGRSFEDGELQCGNVHVALQVRRDPQGLVPGDAAAAEWRTEVLTDAKGGPICARLRWPYLRWEFTA